MFPHQTGRAILAWAKKCIRVENLFTSFQPMYKFVWKQVSLPISFVVDAWKNVYCKIFSDTLFLLTKEQGL